MNWKSSLLPFLLTLALIGLFTALAPVEQTLGAWARIVYLHGAWVWAALLMFLAAALSGLAGLLARQRNVHRWSQAFGRTGLLFWLIFLPMSLVVMQANWNGLFLDEPRFRIPLNFAIVGLLLQVGLSFFPNPAWASLANLGFGVALVAGLSSAQNVLHPESPIFRSEAGSIRFYFGLIFVLLVLAAWQIACWWYQAGFRKPAPSKTATLAGE